MYKYEKIFNKKGQVFACEILMRNSYLINWDKIGNDWLNENTLNQLDRIYRQSFRTRCRRFFLNIERGQLVNPHFLSIVAYWIEKLRRVGISVFLEVTERTHDRKCSVEYLDFIKSKYGFSFVADDVVNNDFRMPEIEVGIYDILKFEPSLIVKIQREMFQCLKLAQVNQGCKFLAEKIDSYTLHKKAMNFALPIDYFQGYFY